ncbi:protein NDNF isoform X2 [Tribolium castaneum]|uniref:Protein NDNF n=1 Tax=Tribolium castaneum TaxID=7070 RepID=D6WX44_TRICA|nr:PREDICTED: protein NDNF isoform X2 [Tribolium castaneum]EFA08046.2 Protein NDNF-like Protein [Tribolium castaneum]|eukprot:XP_008197087.1 PREDICTED: protein NDNF isoform X2 [Tribolium castaneum]
MVARLLSTLLVLHSISVLLPSSCCRKKEPKLPVLQLHTNDSLPADLQVTVGLPAGRNKSYSYTSPSAHGALSVTLTACTSPIFWSFGPDNTTMLHTHSMDTYHVPSPSQGVYTLTLLAPESATLAHIYISTERGGPQALQSAKFSKVRLLKRQKGKRLTVKWNPSLVDPQGTDYCLVVGTKPPVGSLCAAQQDPALAVACVGRKTHHTITGLKHSQKYYFSVFAINNQSNFTYPYGTISSVFDGRFRHTSLKDGKATFANLKKLDGKAVFRYKVVNATESLDLFVIPCGGAIDIEVTLKNATVVPPKRVKSFGRITIKNPVQFARYYIKIYALNREELKKTSGVEIYATTRFPTKIPLPNMPQTLKVTEYKGLTTCDSVTVAWMAAPGQKSAHYCLSATEGKIREMEDYRMPNQCGLESRLKKSVDFAVKFCTDEKNYKEPVVYKTINQLKPGRNYIIQVTVKKPKGKTLSYDLLQVHTKPSCRRKQE